MRVLGKKIRIVLRGPWTKSRASVSYVRDEIDEKGKRTQIQIVDDRIKALNRDYDTGKLKLEDQSLQIAAQQLKAEFDKEIARLRRDKPLSAFNQEVLASFIKNKIEIKTSCQITTLKTDIGRATLATRLLENKSIRTVDLDVIQNILDAQRTDDQNRHLLTTYRKLLRFVGRNEDAERLRRKKYPYKKPPYLLPDQVQQLIDNVPGDVLERFPLMPELITLIYELGLRMSEGFGLKKEDVGKTKNGTVIVRIARQWVKKQDARNEEERLRLPKNRKIRDVIPLNRKRALKALEKWIKTYPTFEEREIYRNAIQRYIKQFCRKNFAIKLDDEKDDDFFFNEDDLQELDEERTYKAVHMLRAGHAVELLKRTSGNYNFVANQIGDNPEVLRKHYSGEVNVASSIDHMAKMVETAG